MSIISTARCSKQHHRNIPFGNKSKPKPVASEAELGRLNKAIILLNQAKKETDEVTYLYKVSEAFKIARNLYRDRND